MTSKYAKVMEVGFLTSLDFIGGSALIAMRGDIIEANEVMKRVRPETWSKISTTKHCMKSITYGLMRVFTRAILMQ